MIAETDRPQRDRKTRAYFAYDAGAQAFNDAFTRTIAKIHKDTIAKYLPPENTHRFPHGGTWSDPGNTRALGGQMQTHSAFLETRFEDIVNNNLDIIVRSFGALAESLHQQFATMLYSTVNDVCERTGNTVDAKVEGSLEAAFMAVLEKIELGVDHNGNVSMPEFHVSPDVGKRMLAALENSPPEYKERIEALKTRKTAEALAREAERKAKFVRYGPDICES